MSVTDNTAGNESVSFRMLSEHEENEFKFSYRHRSFLVTFLPDEDGATPEDPDHEHPVTAEQAATWHAGEWWYHHVLVNAIDSEGANLELRLWTGDSLSRLPSFKDHTGSIKRVCDSICEQLDKHGITPEIQAMPNSVDSDL